MDKTVKRMYVEKKKGFDVEAQGLLHDLKNNLGIHALEEVRILHRYDIQGIEAEEFIMARQTIFSEPTVDIVYDEELPVLPENRVFAVEYLPGQFDQRADSAAQCVQILTQRERPMIRAARVYILQGDMEEAAYHKIKDYCINPVESREAALMKPDSLEEQLKLPADVSIAEGFTTFSPVQLEAFRVSAGFAMTIEDLCFVQEYFAHTEHRDPTVTELKVIDTYWSDHCRHTTFLTSIDGVEFEDGSCSTLFRTVYDRYMEIRRQVHGDKDKAVCLMDLATLAMKKLRKEGKLQDLDESDEINACSIVTEIEVDGKTEEWLVMFKNETHNHPTEIEPFGGAATCLGGAIRDPLSGRAYVYQAMRVTGSGDPRQTVDETLGGKLPQRKITTGAAAGYSSYGNQIGLATGQVAEIYHPGYVAKRMEIGAVIGAAPKSHVKRSKPQPGDVVILLGGRTGRDGCGGATGSSKEHDETSLLTCGAEVQKGNPPTERKIQRLFRNPEVSSLIKKCNDFGAGGVSVAIGELADGLVIDLDAVPKKYEGLDGTELAISESQERMAVVVALGDAECFIQKAGEENLEAVVVAQVSVEPRLQMRWRGKTIVDISRAFLDTNGACQHTQAIVKSVDMSRSALNRIPSEIKNAGDIDGKWLANLQRLQVCSQKGLVERFDSTIGAGTVLMPFGGKYQLSPADGMAARLPVLHGETHSATVMTFGFNPYIAEWSPFHGAVYAIVESLAKITAMGGDYKKCRLTLQEYFEKLGKDGIKWGKPLSALLGAFYVQTALDIPAIGGKDSMSGTFRDLHVPPTLVSFAMCVEDARKVVSQEFKKSGSLVVWLPLNIDDEGMPDFASLDRSYSRLYSLAQQDRILAAAAVKAGGIAETITKMCFGNGIGFSFARTMQETELFAPGCGSIVIELDAGIHIEEILEGIPFEILGYTSDQSFIQINNKAIGLAEGLAHWNHPLESIFPTAIQVPKASVPVYRFDIYAPKATQQKIARPRVLIPVFPGTNCEYDTARQFEKAGTAVDIMVIRNMTPADIEYAMKTMAEKIRQSQIVMLPGGFSAGDEPDGSGKFIATAFRNPYVKEAVTELLQQKDGLMLGICNGFQALIKLGLVPYGEIRDMTEECPTLTYNTIGRHVSTMVRTRVVSRLSPWLANTQLDDMHVIPVSHGEGRFIASPGLLEQMWANGQIATQYVDFAGKPTMEAPFNPNGSLGAIEGITSPDGRIFGKMGHSERVGADLHRNIQGDKDQRLFQAGVQYFQ